MSGECQVNVKSQSELDIGGRETCSKLLLILVLLLKQALLRRRSSIGGNILLEKN